MNPINGKLLIDGVEVGDVICNVSRVITANLGLEFEGLDWGRIIEAQEHGFSVEIQLENGTTVSLSRPENRPNQP